MKVGVFLCTETTKNYVIPFFNFKVCASTILFQMYAIGPVGFRIQLGFYSLILRLFCHMLWLSVYLQLSFVNVNRYVDSLNTLHVAIIFEHGYLLWELLKSKWHIPELVLAILCPGGLAGHVLVDKANVFLISWILSGTELPKCLHPAYWFHWLVATTPTPCLMWCTSSKPMLCHHPFLS